MDRSGLLKAVMTASVILATLAGNPLAVSRAAEQPGTITLAQIEKAWRDRAARVHSGKIAWKETRHLAKGAIERKGEPSPFGMRPAKDVDVPDQPVKHTYTREFAFDRGKLRHVSNEPIWHESLGDFWDGADIAAFDGQVRTSLRPLPKGEKFPAQGLIGHDAGIVLADIAVMPVLWHFCPESRAIDSLKRYSVTEERAKFDGADCVVLAEAPRRVSEVRGTMWLEPKRGFIVRRWIDRLGSVVFSQIDVFYRDDPQHGPVLTGWKWLEQTQEGAMRRLVEAEVTRTELNQAIDPGEFRVQFPPGTLVFELRSERSTDEEKTFFVLPDGTMRPVTRMELTRRVTPEMLAATKPGEAGLLQPRGSRTLWITAIAVLALSIALVLLWRGRKRMKGRQDVSQTAG
jgi:hypothetical protein